MEKKSFANVEFDPTWEKKVDGKIDKALYKTKRGDKSKGKSKSYFYDPMAMLDMLEYKERPTTLSFDLLKRMANRNNVISAIINTRINQVSRFCYPCRTRVDRIGYKIRPLDPKAIITPEMDIELAGIESFLHNTGQLDKDEIRDDFPTFLKKVIRDRLVYDAVAVEMVTNGAGEPYSFYAVDAATIRFALPKDENKTNISARRIMKSDLGYVQYIQGRLVAEFSYDEMAYGVFYPKTDINAFGYGFSELEQLITTVTRHLFAEEYNAKFFSQGAIPKGILNFKGGNMTKEKLEGFRRAWQSQVAGLVGAWRVPVVASPDLQWIDMHYTNQDMEFSKWLDYLVNVTCSVYCIDPAEINFPSRGGTGDSHEKPLFDNSFQSKLQQSKDKGLYPLLDFIAHFINKNIVWKMNPELVFVFEGLDKRMGRERLEHQEKEVKLFKTVNEIRHEEEMDDIEGGEIILDGMYVNNLIQKQQLELQERQQELQLKQQVLALKIQMLETIQMEQAVLGGESGDFGLSEEESSELDGLIGDIFNDREPTLNRIEKETDEIDVPESKELPVVPEKE